MDPSNIITKIEQLIAQDPRDRGIKALVQWGALESAARMLLTQKKALLTSGFYLLATHSGETDGPPGVLAIGHALRGLNIQVHYVTDAPNLPLFQAIGATPATVYHQTLLEEIGPDVLISIERPGRATDGHYYSMRGQDISPHTAPIDEMFLQGPSAKLPTVAIGDGGNEIGMGNVKELVMRDVNHGERIASVVKADHLIVAGVSNFGGYALAGALSVLTGQDLMPTPHQAAEAVRACADAGGHCGQTFVNAPMVDGLPLEDTISMVEDIRNLSGY